MFSLACFMVQSQVITVSLLVGSTSSDVLLAVDCLDKLLRNHRQVSTQRVLGYVKRLSTITMQLLPGAALAVLGTIRKFIQVGFVVGKWKGTSIGLRQAAVGVILQLLPRSVVYYQAVHLPGAVVYYQAVHLPGAVVFIQVGCAVLYTEILQGWGGGASRGGRGGWNCDYCAVCVCVRCMHAVTVEVWLL